MTERMLITKLVRVGDRADLFARGHQYKDLTLFDLSDLVDVGLAFDTLEDGLEVPVRFWAHYELSEKLNQHGNPYKDIISLEPIDKAATSTSTDTSPMLEELRQIRRLLRLVADKLDVPKVDLQTGEIDPPKDPAPEDPLAYADGSPVSDNAAEAHAYAAHIAAGAGIPADVAALRTWVLDTPNLGPPGPDQAAAWSPKKGTASCRHAK